MKSTFFALLASAAVVFASPLPEADADANQGQQPAALTYASPPSDDDPSSSWHGGSSYQPGNTGGGGGYATPQGGHPGGYASPQGGHQGGYAPPPGGNSGGYITPSGGQPDDGYAPPPTGGYPSDPSSYVEGGSYHQESSGDWSHYVSTYGTAPPSQYGHDVQDWNQVQFPTDSPFHSSNGGGLSNYAGTCAASQQAVTCCPGSSSGGLLGNLLSSCTLNLLSSDCKQDVRCCGTQTQQGLVNIGFQCGDLLPIAK